MIPIAISGYLDQKQARYAVLSHPAAYTAQEEAAAAASVNSSGTIHSSGEGK